MLKIVSKIFTVHVIAKGVVECDWRSMRVSYLTSSTLIFTPFTLIESCMQVLMDSCYN